MTCEHCAHSVTAELEALDTITAVSVDVVPQGDSVVTVTSSAGVPQDELRDAVQRAGYELVGESLR